MKCPSRMENPSRMEIENICWDGPIHVAVGPSQQRLRATYTWGDCGESMWHTCGTFSLDGPKATCRGPSQPRFSQPDDAMNLYVIIINTMIFFFFENR